VFWTIEVAGFRAGFSLAFAARRGDQLILMVRVSSRRPSARSTQPMVRNEKPIFAQSVFECE
jgi:hypothetical protein